MLEKFNLVKGDSKRVNVIVLDENGDDIVLPDAAHCVFRISHGGEDYVVKSSDVSGEGEKISGKDNQFNIFINGTDTEELEDGQYCISVRVMTDSDHVYTVNEGYVMIRSICADI